MYYLAILQKIYKTRQQNNMYTHLYIYFRYIKIKFFNNTLLHEIFLSIYVIFYLFIVLLKFLNIKIEKNYEPYHTLNIYQQQQFPGNPLKQSISSPVFHLYLSQLKPCMLVLQLICSENNRAINLESNSMESSKRY